MCLSVIGLSIKLYPSLYLKLTASPFVGVIALAVKYYYHGQLFDFESADSLCAQVVEGYDFGTFDTFCHQCCRSADSREIYARILFQCVYYLFAS